MPVFDDMFWFTQTLTNYELQFKYSFIIVKGRVPQEAPGNKHVKTHPNPFLTFSVTHLEASLLYVMFQAASKVKTWNSGLIASLHLN